MKLKMANNYAEMYAPVRTPVYKNVLTMYVSGSTHITMSANTLIDTPVLY